MKTIRPVAFFETMFPTPEIQAQTVHNALPPLRWEEKLVLPKKSAQAVRQARGLEPLPAYDCGFSTRVVV